VQRKRGRWGGIGEVDASRVRLYKEKKGSPFVGEWRIL